MPVDLPVGDHALFLWTAVATHAVVGYAVGAVVLDEPAWGLLGGVVADVDLLFPLAWEWPLVHRGITHSALAAALLAGVVVLAGIVAVSSRNRDAALATGGGYASHLAIDATTASGVPLLYPLSSTPVTIPLGGHSSIATTLLWCGSLAALWAWRRRGSETSAG